MNLAGQDSRRSSPNWGMRPDDDQISRESVVLPCDLPEALPFENSDDSEGFWFSNLNVREIIALLCKI